MRTRTILARQILKTASIGLQAISIAVFLQAIHFMLSTPTGDLAPWFKAFQIYLLMPLVTLAGAWMIKLVDERQGRMVVIGVCYFIFSLFVLVRIAWLLYLLYPIGQTF